MYTLHHSAGFSLLEVVLGVAVMFIVFSTLINSFQALSTLGERNHLRAGALLLANEHLEVIRALPYDSIGTVAGLPPGSIPQLETVVQDGTTYTRRTFIQYVDDPADGLGAADTLAADYKRIKVELSYYYHGATSSFSMVTTVAPKSQESLVGAGILRINVNDADSNPVSLASVHVVNNTVATSVDVTTYTNASGTVSFPGAWEGTGYEVYVSRTGYSGAQTYTATTSNPNPSPSPLTIAENSTTEVYFKIDLLSTLDFYARYWPVYGGLSDPFDNTSNISSLGDTQVTGGTLTLAGGPGTYPALGTTTSVAITPASLDTWLLLYATSSLPSGTGATYTVEYDTGGGVFTPIPDGDLPGNSAGFTTMPIDLGGLATSTYDSLRIYATLTSSDPNETPAIDAWSLSYYERDVPHAGTDITLQSTKTIGTESGGDPIYKYLETHTTDIGGSVALTDMEFDEYDVTVTGAEVSEACPSLPLVLDPDTAYQQTLTLSSATTNAYQVTVIHPLGGTVPRAEVTLERLGVETTLATGPCGIAYFPGLSADTYNVTIRAAGLAEHSSSQAVSGLTTDAIILSL
jgi:type II secretory pathway pseudopilin PulG